jgi:hypothetical protein
MSAAYATVARDKLPVALLATGWLTTEQRRTRRQP